MATLTVWRFDSPDGARGALDLLERLQKEQLLRLDDAATVSWEQGRKKPYTEQLPSIAGTDALLGSFWGLLFGLLFFIPLLGMAVGAAMGALAGSMSDVGIDGRFIREVREKVTPGTSALFLMTSDVVQDKVLEHFRSTGAQLVSTNLSKDQEQRLCEVFGEEYQTVQPSEAR